MLPDQESTAVKATIIALSMLSHNVLQVKLKTDDYSPFSAGQYINLIAAGNLIPSYSIANLPCQGQHIELHIKLMQVGLMSQWISHQATVGSPLHVRGPMGDCFSGERHRTRTINGYHL